MNNHFWELDQPLKWNIQTQTDSWFDHDSDNATYNKERLIILIRMQNNDIIKNFWGTIPFWMQHRFTLLTVSLLQSCLINSKDEYDSSASLSVQTDLHMLFRCWRTCTPFTSDSRGQEWLTLSMATELLCLSVLRNLSHPSSANCRIRLLMAGMNVP